MQNECISTDVSKRVNNLQKLITQKRQKDNNIAHIGKKTDNGVQVVIKIINKMDFFRFYPTPEYGVQISFPALFTSSIMQNFILFVFVFYLDFFVAAVGAAVFPYVLTYRIFLFN